MTPGKIMFIVGIFLTLFIAIIPHAVWLLGWLISLITGHHLKYAPFGWTALGLTSIVIILLSYGFFIGRWQLKVNCISYVNESIPVAFNNFKIVHISDLHLSTFNDRPDKLKTFVETINTQKPDLICFTGDLVTMGLREAEPYTEALLKLNSRYGIVSIFGNHDFLIYGRRFKTKEERNIAVDSLADFEHKILGWSLLRNSSKKIYADDGSYITIIGVDNKNCSNQIFKTIDCGNLPMAMEGTSGFRILLSHDPSHWDAEVLSSTNIPLTLSGHTHASQVSIFGWTPASFMFPRSYGRFDEGTQTLYVNRGLGCTIPFRIGARPEITIITLNSR